MKRLEHQGCRIKVRTRKAQFFYKIVPTKARPFWSIFTCTRPFDSEQEGVDAALRAIDGRIADAK